MVSLSPRLRPAVFLDRDGVIVIPEFRDQRSFAPRRLEDFRLYPEAAASLQRLKRAGFVLAVVTNQPDVGNGVTARAEVDAMHEIMRRELPVDVIKAASTPQPTAATAASRSRE
jgi:D-glycero-D-manno-heptose 1,7-bisphosphate phosphatase